jgi:hypothetical protein
MSDDLEGVTALDPSSTAGKYTVTLVPVAGALSIPIDPR